MRADPRQAYPDQSKRRCVVCPVRPSSSLKCTHLAKETPLNLQVEEEADPLDAFMAGLKEDAQQATPAHKSEPNVALRLDDEDDNITDFLEASYLLARHPQYGGLSWSMPPHRPGARSMVPWLDWLP